MRGKKTRMEDINIEIEWVDQNTPEGKASWDNGLRILAHWIAEAYLKEQRGKYQKELENNNSQSTTIPNSTQNSSSIKISPHTVKSEDLPPDRLGFTRKEVAKLLGVGISTVYKAIENKQLRSVEFGGRVVIPKIALLEFLHNTGDKEDPQKGQTNSIG